MISLCCRGDSLSSRMQRGQSSGVEINAARVSVLLVVESHPGRRVEGYLSLVTSSMPTAKRP